jgi:hypothetical protein
MEGSPSERRGIGDRFINFVAWVGNALFGNVHFVPPEDTSPTGHMESPASPQTTQQTPPEQTRPTETPARPLSVADHLALWEQELKKKS